VDPVELRVMLSLVHELQDLFLSELFSVETDSFSLVYAMFTLGFERHEIDIAAGVAEGRRRLLLFILVDLSLLALKGI